MVREEKYVRRKRAITACIAIMLTASYYNVRPLALFQASPLVYAYEITDTNDHCTSSATDSTTTTSETSTSPASKKKTTTSTSTTSTTTTITSSTTTTTTSTTTIVAETSSKKTDIEENVDTTCTTTDEAFVDYIESASNVESKYEPGEYPDEYVFSSGYVKGSADYILLCNCLGLEYGSDTVDTYEKAKVIEVILNRVSSDSYPNTVYGVISQPYQFSGSSEYLYLDTYSSRVTYSVEAAVDWYLDEGWQTTNHGFIGFSGDGWCNYFH